VTDNAARPTLPRYWGRSLTVLEKDAWGRIVLVSGFVRRGRLAAAWMQPASAGAGWTQVPYDALDAVIHAQTWEQAMAEVRSS
jgi:hypothetical protein